MKIKLLLISMLSVLILTGCNGAKNAVETEEAKDVIESSTETEVITLNTEGSTVTWKGEKVTGSNHIGTIEVKSGEVFFEDKVLVGGNFILDMTTIQENIEEQNEQLINHLRSDDFFSVESHPEASFEITNVTETESEGATHTIEGNLTIKGISKNIEFEAYIQESNNVFAATANFEIDRTDWDVRFGSGKFFDDLGDNAIKDAIEFQLNLVTNETE